VQLILASGSPRRRELLARLGVPFDVLPADVDEAPRPGEEPLALALRLSRTKAEAVAAARTDAVVLAADTVVARGRTLYGKPADRDEAAAMLSRLVGRGHRVITGLTVVAPGRQLCAAATSRVWLQPWDQAAIAAYVASGDPLDKAGAYGIQNERFQPVARRRGCHCNVVGFPLGLVARLLAEVGLPPPVDPALACPSGQYRPARCDAAARS
jgi:septum formation protein